ncbi:MAG: hypothetical protein WAT37_10505 [Saprospiraceae bacterium]
MKHYLLINLVLISNFIYGQSVGIGTTSPESSAILEVKSTTQGFMMPRMTTAQRDAIVAPKQGLQIYNTDDRCQDIYDGSKWAKNCDMKVNGDSELPANSWRPRADFGGDLRYAPVAFSIGNKGYIGTGFDGTYKKDFWEFDPASNVWTQKADFGGTARQGAVGFSMAGKGYVGTGENGIFNNDFWEYNLTSNVWTQRANFGGSARFNAVGFSIADKGYIGTGATNSSRYKDFWEYDSASNVWTQKLDFGGTARGNAVGFSTTDKGYIGTGSDGIALKKDFWEFIPAGGGLGSWVQKADFAGTARQKAVGFSINNKGYIGTGSISDQVGVKDFWEYNPATNVWLQKADFGGSARFFAIGFSIGSKGYIGVGSDESYYKRDFWEYNTVPESGKVYVENIPSDAVIYQGHDWTSSGNNLYTTLENVNTTTRGLLNADGGFRTKYSGTIVKTIAAGASNIILNINPVVPSDWDFTNTMVTVSVADDPLYLRVTMYLAKLTSPGTITLSINALGAGQIRFNYIVFKL